MPSNLKGGTKFVLFTTIFLVHSPSTNLKQYLRNEINEISAIIYALKVTKVSLKEGA